MVRFVRSASFLGSAVLLFTACGQPRATMANESLTSTCALATGTYVSEATLRFKEGVCPRAKEHTRDRLEFEEGAFVSPASALIPCSTQQKECALTVTCQVFDLEMVFTGELVDEATRLVGVATFSGKGDCQSAVYDMEAARPVTP